MEGESGKGGHGTSETASRSFCAGWFLVEPVGVRMVLVRVACNAANLGLF